MRVYFISGLGADERMFRHLRLPESFRAVYLPWFPPHGNESLSDYALRMSAFIDTTENFVVVGLSLGGMIATEIGLRFPQATVILISSIPVYKHLPWIYRAAGSTGAYRLVPVKYLKHAAYIKRLFSAETSEHKRMLRQMIVQSDTSFIKWGLQAILHWRNERLPAHFFHIHGGSDRILPSKNTHPDKIVKGAGHLMVLDRHEQVNEWLNSVLMSLTVGTQ